MPNGIAAIQWTDNPTSTKLASEPADPELASVSATVTSLAAVDISANGELHWRLFYQASASDNSIQQIDYYDNKWHTATTICTGTIPRTPLAAVDTITPPGKPDTSATLILFFKDIDGDPDEEYLRLFAWQYGSRLDHPASSTICIRDGSRDAAYQVSPGHPRRDKMAPSGFIYPMPRGPRSRFELGIAAEPLAAITEISGSGERIITVYTGSESGKEISGFCCHDEVWTQIDPVQWDNLTTYTLCPEDIDPA
ncbi:hypothetical protein GGX14DRAFT_385483 [Mycena pura]|uniref:Fucose-specific lectin n=1 Tax=Mycena pura TaxID=153505 RepID=A0AAD6YQI8_9AGAR|nr:hypothetical protein GGX14DRAFT_385483 [Mycena pura]